MTRSWWLPFGNEFVCGLPALWNNCNWTVGHTKKKKITKYDSKQMTQPLNIRNNHPGLCTDTLLFSPANSLKNSIREVFNCRTQTQHQAWVLRFFSHVGTTTTCSRTWKIFLVAAFWTRWTGSGALVGKCGGSVLWWADTGASAMLWQMPEFQ